jgi:pimeloyl-ACP methyl ester carboxylesterase
MSVMVLFPAVVLILAAAGTLYQRAGTKRSARTCPPPGRMVDVGDHRLHVQSAGRGGPAVVLEAGIAASSLSWSRVLPGVAAFAQTCAYDRAGLGWSEAGTERRTLANIVDDLDALLTRAAVNPPYVLVGHSFGCFIACAYASRHPDRTAGLVFVDPPAASEWHQPTPARARMLRGGIHLSRVGGVLARVGVVRASLALLTGGAPAAPRTLVKVFGPTAARTVERLVGEVRKLPPDVHPLVQANWSQPKAFRAMEDHLRILVDSAAFISRLKSLPDVPVVMISSGDQPPAIIEEHRQLARLSPRGRHMVAARSGHWILFDEPELVVDAIRSVVSESRKQTSDVGSPSARGNYV